jgi:hypothetical protein
MVDVAAAAEWTMLNEAKGHHRDRIEPNGNRALDLQRYVPGAYETAMPATWNRRIPIRPSRE